MAVSDADPAERPPAAGSPAPAVLDPQHAGDIVAALGTLAQDEEARPRSWRRKLRLLLIILGPGLIVMGGGNDAGGVQVYLQLGQDYGMRLLWTLILLFPILYVCQEMVLRLGAVSGVGHGRLIFARFGTFWGCFAVGDLFIINAVTVAAEFIGVEQGLSYFGLSSAVAVPASAVLLFLVMAGGSYRYWERFLIGLVIADFVVFPIAYFVHTSVAASAAGAVPSLPGGVNAGMLLLVVAVVGTTVEPWQMFFQQSSVVDKRITPRWINYERMDTLIGVLIEVGGALVLMAATAFGLAHTAASGTYTDLSATMGALERHVGRGAGALLALVTVDGSLIGANLTALTIGYTLGDVTSGRMRHSLHWKPGQAPFFYALYAVLVALAAAVTLAWADQLGVVINGVEALNGILLPSALVFLVLLANDRAVLGPWVNGTAHNWACGIIVWAVTTFSLAPVVTTFYPNVTLRQIVIAFLACTALGVAAAAVIWRRPSRGRRAAPAADAGRRPPGMGRAERRAALRERRLAWRTPRIDTLERPAASAARWVGLLTLRAYIVFAVVVVVIKLVQTAAAR